MLVLNLTEFWYMYKIILTQILYDDFLLTQHEFLTLNSINYIHQTKSQSQMYIYILFVCNFVHPKWYFFNFLLKSICRLICICLQTITTCNSKVSLCCCLRILHCTAYLNKYQYFFSHLEIVKDVTKENFTSKSDSNKIML